jgi:hypothetical protein
MANPKFALAAALAAVLVAPAAFANDYGAPHPGKGVPTFEQIDANKDGGITLDELKASLAKHPKMLKRADKMFQHMDKNKDGKVDASEYNTWKAHRGQRKPH